MAKLRGSVAFGTTNINSEEYVMMAKIWTENGSTTEEAMLEIEALDDCLELQRVRTIINQHRFTEKGFIRKDSTLRDFISKRYGILVDDLKSIGELENDNNIGEN